MAQLLSFQLMKDGDELCIKSVYKKIDRMKVSDAKQRDKQQRVCTMKKM
jgi:hypothetical protein